jgi:hypothetical protein
MVCVCVVGYQVLRKLVGEVLTKCWDLCGES